MSKEPMVTQDELDRLTVGRLRPLLGILDAVELIARDGDDVITESGQITAKAAATFAENAAIDLFEVIVDRTPAGVDTEHAREAHYLCALSATAIRGVEMYDCPGMDGAAVILALRSWGQRLDERFAERLSGRGFGRAGAQDEEVAHV